MEPDTYRTKGEPSVDLEKAMSTLGIDKLNKFRERVGIIDVIDLGSRAKRRPAPNVGIYKRIASEERKAKLEYYACALLINACLLAQVIFASALTALGAGHGSHNQITGLGAANTVIAAILTFTKGSGLPNSLRQYQQLLRKVREYIEQRERDFTQSDCKLSVDLEIQRIKEMYEEARQIHENNDTSTYNKPAVVPGQDKPLATKLSLDQPLSSPRGGDSPVHISKGPMRSMSEGNEPGDKSEDAHTEIHTPKPNGSERWNIAQAVASRMVEYTGENAQRFSFSGPAGQLRGSSPTAADSSGSSAGSGGSPSVGRRRPPTSSPSPTAIIQTHRPPTRPTMPAPPTIPARPTFSLANPPTTRNPSTPPPSRRFNPNSQSPDYGPPDDEQSPDYGPPDDEQSPDFDPPDDNQSPDYGPPDDDDLDDFGVILGATANAGEGGNPAEEGNVEEPEAGEEAQHEAQNETTQQEPLAPKSTTKTSKSKSRKAKAKAKSGRVDKQSKPKSKPRTSAATRARRSRQTIETPSDAPARNTRSQTGGRGGRVARSGGTRFGYEELERVEREGRRMRRLERERKGKGKGGG